MFDKKRCIYLFCSLCLSIFCGCSTTRNTAGTRFFHSMVTHYNIWYNGNNAFKDGYSEQEKAHKENYLEVIPPLIAYNSESIKQGKGKFDLAIEKAQKGIKFHSISVPPKKKNKQLSSKEKAYRQRGEFNPFMWKMWFLMADAQQQKGDFLEAAGTYSYITKLYSFDNDIATRARIGMARCYSLLGWDYQADQVFAECQTYPISPALQNQYHMALGAHLVKQERYKEGIPHIEQGIERRSRTKTERYREDYLLGQLYFQTGQNGKAYQSFARVIKRNPPYQTDLNARIAQTETMVGKGNALKKLQRLTKNNNNQTYLDRIYYAIGNIHLSRQDTVSTLKNWELGAAKGESASAEKGILYLHMANIYWEKRNYSNAGRCYSEAIGLINNHHPEYQTIKLRSEHLDNLSAHVNNIVLQDSLLYLSTLSQDKITAIIDAVIEREMAEKAQQEKEKQEQEKINSINSMRSSMSMATENDGSWYFYNKALIAQGMKQFQEKWGNRTDQDDWRRSNKSATAQFLQKADSTDTAKNDTVSLPPAEDSTQESENYSSEYDQSTYRANIPFTPEQKKKCTDILTDALFKAGLIYKDNLSEYEMAEKMLTRVSFEHPYCQEDLQSLYNLFLLYSLTGNYNKAKSCKDSLSARYPDNKITLTVNAPDFEENARYGKHREDSLYAETYTAYTQGNYELVRSNCQKSQTVYPAGNHRAKFLFIEAMLNLQDGKTQVFLESLKNIIATYPSNEITELSMIIYQGVEEGKIMQSTDVSSLWERKFGDSRAQSDSVERQLFTAERLDPFLCVIAYQADSTNSNQLLFEIAKYNFSNFMVRSFDTNQTEINGIGLMKIGTFNNFDEAFLYHKRLCANGEMSKKLSGMEIILITPSDLELLLSESSFSEYNDFYNKKFLKIPEPDIDGTTIFEELNYGDE